MDWISVLIRTTELIRWKCSRFQELQNCATFIHKTEKNSFLLLDNFQASSILLSRILFVSRDAAIIAASCSLFCWVLGWIKLSPEWAFPYLWFSGRFESTSRLAHHCNYFLLKMIVLFYFNSICFKCEPNHPRFVWTVHISSKCLSQICWFGLHCLVFFHLVNQRKICGCGFKWIQ